MLSKQKEVVFLVMSEVPGQAAEADFHTNLHIGQCQRAEGAATCSESRRVQVRAGSLAQPATMT